MSDYDYLNARIKGMHSNLLSREFYEQILSNQGIGPFVDTLLSSPYSPHIREALERDRSVSGIEWGLRRNLFDTFEKIRSLATSEPRRLLSIQFRKWDMQSIIAILRGKAADLLAEEILTGVFPAGELSDVELEELAAEDNVKSILDTLTVWNFPLAFELRKVVKDFPGEFKCTFMESKFMQIFFSWAQENLDIKDDNCSLLRNHIQDQIDLVNIKSVLWVVSQKEIGRRPEPIPLVPGGHISVRKLSQIEQSSSLEISFEILAETYFRRAIDRGILVFGESRRLAVMERFIELEVAERGCRMFRSDPLGIGVPMGYILRKYNEFLNLRILLRDNSFGKPAPAIREELCFVESFSN